jgi:hypothetical protein
MRKTSKIMLIIFMCLTAAAIAFGVDFIVRDKYGAYVFDCINACGPVKIKKSGKCKYMVRSKYFRGIVESCSAENAARQACGEEPFKTPVRDDLISTSCL